MAIRSQSCNRVNTEFLNSMLGELRRENKPVYGWEEFKNAGFSSAYSPSSWKDLILDTEGVEMVCGLRKVTEGIPVLGR